jgi:uncharacterized membrane protein YidH (DUF202 family)
MTQPSHHSLTPVAAVLPGAGQIVRESPPLRPAAAATLLADGNDRREAQELPEMERWSSLYGEDESRGREDDAGHPVARTDTGSSSAMRGNGVRVKIRRWWAQHVSLGVSPNSRRDFLGRSTFGAVACFPDSRKGQRFLTRPRTALERTYLGYVRTSVALSTTGVTLAQLFRLTGSMDTQGPVRGGFAVAVSFIVAAVLVVLLGATRYWRQQTALARGKVWAGGFELLLIMGLVVLVSELFWSCPV